MKKLLMILFAGALLTACERGNQSEANRDDEYETTEPSVSTDDDMDDDDTRDTTNTMSQDTTGTAPSADDAPAR